MQYLTVSIPRIPPAEIKGIKVAEKAGILLDFPFSNEPDKTNQGKSTWYLMRPEPVTPVTEFSDAVLYGEGYIVIVPMKADEHAYELFKFLQKNLAIVPAWVVKR